MILVFFGYKHDSNLPLETIVDYIHEKNTNYKEYVLNYLSKIKFLNMTFMQFLDTETLISQTFEVKDNGIIEHCSKNLKDLDFAPWSPSVYYDLQKELMALNKNDVIEKPLHDN